MDQRDQRTIKNNLTDLIERTEFDSQLEDKLLEKDIFNINMLETIRRAGTRFEQKRKMYLDVQRRGPHAYKNLVQALVETGNLKAARVLDPTLDLSEDLSDDQPEEDQNKVWNPPNYQEDILDRVIIPPVLDNNTEPLKIQVKKAAAANPYKTSDLPCYPMTSDPRGLVLIIDNENFDNEVLPTRTGSLVDANNLDILFEQLGFKVTLRRNLAYYDMMSEVQKFAAREEHKTGDMTVVVLLSHGRHGLIAAADGRELETEWVMRQFNNEGCPALRGKPKLFLLQACRGDEADYGVLPSINFPEGKTVTDARRLEPQAPEVEGETREVTWEDILVAYATLPGYVANRDRYRGTWFIESLCSVFMEMAAERDLRDMLDIVGQRLKNYESEVGTKQSFAYEVRHFYKKLFFNPS